MQTWPDLVSSGEAHYARPIVYVQPGHLIGEREPQIMPCHELYTVPATFSVCVPKFGPRLSDTSVEGPGSVDGGEAQMLIV